METDQLEALTGQDCTEIWEWENQRLTANGNQPENIFASWHAPWRLEALEYYLPLGWSMALRNAENKPRGYFLAQPLLFWRGYTQVLWVEHLAAEDSETKNKLLETVYKMAREKHLQKVYLAGPELWSDSAPPSIKSSSLQADFIVLATTSLNESPAQGQK